MERRPYERSRTRRPRRAGVKATSTGAGTIPCAADFAVPALGRSRVGPVRAFPRPGHPGGVAVVRKRIGAPVPARLLCMALLLTAAMLARGAPLRLPGSGCPPGRRLGCRGDPAARRTRLLSRVGRPESRQDHSRRRGSVCRSPSPCESRACCHRRTRRRGGTRLSAWHAALAPHGCPIGLRAVSTPRSPTDSTLATARRCAAEAASISVPCAAGRCHHGARSRDQSDDDERRSDQHHPPQTS